MNGRSILCSLAILAGCSGPTRSSSDGLPNSGSEALLKVTYIRFNFDQRQQRYVPIYRVIVSESWRSKFGETSNEPFHKLFPPRGGRAPYFGPAPDEKMRLLLDELKQKGLEDLVSVAPEDIDLLLLAQAGRNKEEAPYTRIVTVGGETWSKSYTFRNNNGDAEAIRKFLACEKAVNLMANLYTAQISVEAQPRRDP